MSEASPYVNVVVEGCCHGALDEIYASVGQIEKRRAVKVDLLIICGDFQALRNEDDYESLAVPPKYRSMESFYKYYSGEKVAPVLTLVIGGNHEASNYMMELFHGGWLAPNIYYLGAAGVVNYGGLRIAGSSGIYKSGDYHRGHFEGASLNSQLPSNAVRSAYHTRQTQIYQLSQLGRDGAPSLRKTTGSGGDGVSGQEQQQGGRGWVDVFLSHDWPTGVVQYGDGERLLRAKPFFRDEVASNTLGSPPYEDLLHRLKPSYWFAAHLHCKFAALIPHHEDSNISRQAPNQLQEPSSPPPSAALVTRFLALDKCLPRRDFLQLVTLPRPPSEQLEQATKPSPSYKRAVLEYDPEWLAILRATHGILSTSHSTVHVPPSCSFVTQRDVESAAERATSFNGSLEIPSNFVATAPAYPHRQQQQQRGSGGGGGGGGGGGCGGAADWGVCGNPQTDSFLAMMDLPHAVTVPFRSMAGSANPASSINGAGYGGACGGAGGGGGAASNTSVSYSTTTSTTNSGGVGLLVPSQVALPTAGFVIDRVGTHFPLPTHPPPRPPSHAPPPLPPPPSTTQDNNEIDIDGVEDGADGGGDSSTAGPAPADSNEIDIDDL